MPARAWFFLVIVVSVGLAPAVRPDEPIPAPRAELPEVGRCLSLADCIQIGMENQPALIAYRASLGNAVLRAQAVDRMHVPHCLAPYLPIRKQQAPLGVSIAAAAVDVGEHEAIYAIALTYYSAVYAGQQARMADRALKSLAEFKEKAAELNKAGRTDITDRHVARMEVLINAGKARREEAVVGRQRALAALREAMGVGPDMCQGPCIDELPDPQVEVCREQIIELALSRRGELTQALLGVEVTALEIKAQSLQKGKRADTFAVGRDSGALQVPETLRNGHYRPGGVPIEMPPQVVGTKDERVQQVSALYARVVAVADKARNLITLEAEETYFKWLESSRKLRRLRKASADAGKLATGLREDLIMQVGKVTPDDVLNVGTQAAQLRADATQALYHNIVALSALERVTAGGFCAGLEQPVMVVPDEAR